MVTALSAQTKKAQDRFLDAFAAIGTIAGAAQAASVGRRTHYGWMANDPDYRARFEAARDELVDSLEQEAIRRARDGVVKGVYHNGTLIATEHQYSDTLLIFLLKANRPDKFKDRIGVTQDVTVTHVDSFQAAIERLERDLGGSSRRSPVASEPTPASD